MGWVCWTPRHGRATLAVLWYVSIGLPVTKTLDSEALGHPVISGLMLAQLYRGLQKNVQGPVILKQCAF